jgi:cephalosporin hydroxylase
VYPFWDFAVWPVIQAAEAKRIVEIGALFGNTTELMLERLGEGVELHVIDPVPAFDPTEHEKRFPGQYLFHRDLSLNVIPQLPAVDVALIDGDHNWYTVFNELRLLREGSERAGAPLPVFVLHDVCWPYGRRDLYYAPEQIPEEFRQPHAQKGMRRESSELVDKGGLNPTMHNALVEGGPRNGVMTGVDDFVASLEEPVRVIVLPVYFGLAIVVAEERLERQPALAQILDGLVDVDGQARQAEVAESMRLQAMVFQHNSHYRAETLHEQLATRYLDVLAGALLDDHYIENEARISYLVERAEKEGKPEMAALRDPGRMLQPRLRAIRAAHEAGRLHDDDGTLVSFFPYSDMGRRRLDHLRGCLETIRSEKVQGDLVECGTGRGGGAVFMRGYLEAHALKGPIVWVADRFRTNPIDEAEALGDLLPDLNMVREAFQRFDLLDGRVRFLQGDPRDTLVDARLGSVALLRIGPGLGADAAVVLELLYDRLTVGGFVVVDDHADEASRAAVEDFRARRGIGEPFERVDWSAAGWRKLQSAAAPDDAGSAVVPTATPPARAPLAGGVPTKNRCDLSVVVVFYEMRREAARTLHALSRAYQRDLDGVDYEVIVVENGSSDEQRLGEELVRSYGPEFRYIDMGKKATSSPTPALNKGIAAARGDVVALMIDGAHILTPGVLSYGLRGMATYGPAVVVTQQWYVGPAQQPDAMLEGYDQTYEDRLFDEISWPTDGYRLFEIGHFIGARDWLDGLWESNCIFVPRHLLEQVGGFDDSFSMAGGGYANLELYERLGSSPDVKVVTMLGEGSFHQIHGGTTTNLAEAEKRHRKLQSFADHFEDLRGKRFIGHRKPIHYVGSLTEDSRRSRPRRMVAPHFFRAGQAGGIDGRPTEPSPMPQEIVDQFVEAYWTTLLWREPTWLGKKVHRLPSDLFAYQELLTKVRPDWVVETGTGNGGRALFLASICDLLGRGQVISIDPNEVTGRPEHDRISYVTAPAWEEETIEKVRAQVGEPARALVILGSGTNARRTRAEFDGYSPLVPVGSYVVIENTIVNGHPVWPGYGPGPAEVVKGIVEKRDAFVYDLDMERYKLTFNPGGYLKRIS